MPSSRRTAVRRSASSSSPSAFAHDTRTRPSPSSTPRASAHRHLGRFPRDGGRHRERTRASRSASRSTDGAARRRSALELRRRRHSVVGRISPEDKKRVVEALARAGRYVAMIGDGVNDVPALKTARLAIAQGSGSQIAKCGCGHRARPRRVLGRPVDGRRGPEGPSQPAACREALRRQVGLCVVPHPLHRPDPARLSAPSAPSHPRRGSRGRHPGVLPRARPERGPLPERPLSIRRRSVRLPRRDGGRSRRAVELRLLALRARPRPRGRAHGRRLRPRPGRALPDPRAGGGRSTRSAAVSMLCLALLGAYAVVLALPFTREFFELALPVSPGG